MEVISSTGAVIKVEPELVVPSDDVIEPVVAAQQQVVSPFVASPPQIADVYTCSSYAAEQAVAGVSGYCDEWTNGFSDHREYAYEEPAENFISIDDLKVKPFLVGMMKNTNSVEEPKEEVITENSDEIEITPVVNEVIELDDDDTNSDMSSSDPYLGTMIEVIMAEDDEEDEDEVISINNSENDHVRTNGMMEDDDDDPDEIDENEDGIELDWTDLEMTENDTEKTTFKCPLCNKKVVSNYNLRRHMMIHTGERPFGCDLCSRRFREFSDLKKHRKVHANDHSYKCMVCRKNTPSETNPIKCIECEKATPPKSSTFTDMQLDSVVSIPCLEGSQKKAYVCPSCDRIFGSRHNLKRHYMIHTGEKPFACEVCSKCFREVSTLKKHMLIHSRIKLYKCLNCDLKFCDFNAYTRHRWRKHSDLGEGAYVSSASLFAVSNESTLIDSDEDDTSSTGTEKGLIFECSECGKKFADVSFYTEHLKVHTHVFTFQCYVCKKMFRSKEYLTSHMLTHTKQEERPRRKKGLK